MSAIEQLTIEQLAKQHWQSYIKQALIEVEHE